MLVSRNSWARYRTSLFPIATMKNILGLARIQCHPNSVNPKVILTLPRIGHVSALFRLLATALIALVIVASARGDEIIPKTASISGPAQIEHIRAAAMPLNETILAQRQQELKEREQYLERHHQRAPPLPKSEKPIERLRALPRTALPTALNSTQTSIKTILDRVLTIRETGGPVSTICEPSLAMRGDDVLVTGNWFASFSTNASSPISEFKSIRPGDLFPPPESRLEFCCDQLAVYEPRRDILIWLLQYEYHENGDGNLVRLAVAKGDDIKNQKWRYYDLTPDAVGHYKKEWFDFPAWAVSNNYLYVTTNSFATCCGDKPPFARSIAIRIPLDKLAAYQGFNLQYFDTKDFGTGDQLFSLCPTQGASSTMYLGAHVSESKLRVYTWPDAGDKVVATDVDVEPWSSDQPVAPNPYGGDWLTRADSRITAGWASKNTIGFAWIAAMDVNHHFPHVRVVILENDTKNVLEEPHIYSGDFAYAYPAAAPNADGEVGVAVEFGGNTINPSSAVGVLKRSRNGQSSWDLATSAAGKAFPPSGQWGDYVTMRLDGKNPKNWVAASFIRDNNGTPQVSYHIFTLK